MLAVASLSKQSTGRDAMAIDAKSNAKTTDRGTNGGRPGTGFASRGPAKDIVALVLLAATFVFIHLSVPGPAPSGGDGGNWLALSNELLGANSMSADVTYPILFPALVAAGQMLLEDPIVALVGFALLGKVVLVWGTYICARPLGRILALAAAVTVGCSGALLEAYAWGAYPQILAQGLGLIATCFIFRYLISRVGWHLAIGLLFAGLTLATHLMIGALMAAAVLVGVLHLVYLTDSRTAQRRRLLRTGLLLALALIMASTIDFAVHSANGLAPTINPAGLGLWEAIASTVSDAPFPWAIVALVAIATVFFRSWPDRVASTIAVGSSWALTSVLLFVVVGEPRALLVTQTGLVLLAVAGFGAGRRRLQPTVGAHTEPAIAKRYRSQLMVIGGLSLFAAIVAGGIVGYGPTTAWYRVVDEDELVALEALREVSDPTDYVVAATGHNGNPVGWWVEGYARRPTYTAIESGFLAFPDERHQAEIATRLFNGQLSDGQSRELLAQIGARYIVVDTRGPDASWLDTPIARSLPVIDDSSYLTVLSASSGA